jgi:hypothetical protein
MKKNIEYYIALIDENMGFKVYAYLEKRIKTIIKANPDISSCKYQLMFDKIVIYNINNNSSFCFNLNGCFDTSDSLKSALIVLGLKESNMKKMLLKIERIHPIIEYFNKTGLGFEGFYERF